MSSENSYFQEHWLSDERFKDWLVPAQMEKVLCIVEHGHAST